MRAHCFRNVVVLGVDTLLGVGKSNPVQRTI